MRSWVHPGLFSSRGSGAPGSTERTRTDAVRGPSRAVQRGVRGGPQTRAEMPVRGVLQGCSAGGVRSTGVHGRGLMRSGVHPGLFSGG